MFIEPAVLFFVALHDYGRKIRADLWFHTQLYRLIVKFFHFGTCFSITVSLISYDFAAGILKMFASPWTDYSSASLTSN